MKIPYVLLSIALLTASCQPKVVARVTQYAVSENRYAVIATQEPGMSAEDARLAAYTEAARLTAAKGYRFFEVDQEQTVQVIEPSGSAPMPSNLYQELIIEKGQGQSSLQAPTSQNVSGVKLTIRMVRENKSGKSIDSCRYTKCQ